MRAPPPSKCLLPRCFVTCAEWREVLDVQAPAVRLEAYSLLQEHYRSTGGADFCGPLLHNPDTDVLVLGACTKVGMAPATADSSVRGILALPSAFYPAHMQARSNEAALHNVSWPVQDDLHALLFFASYTCKQQLCNGTPCVYGVKLLGTARALAGKDPLPGQVNQVDVAPSSGQVVQSKQAAVSAGEHCGCLPAIAPVRLLQACLDKPHRIPHCRWRGTSHTPCWPEILSSQVRLLRLRAAHVQRLGAPCTFTKQRLPIAEPRCLSDLINTPILLLQLC